MKGYILVEEDSRTQADMLCHILNQVGYEIDILQVSSQGKAMGTSFIVRLPNNLNATDENNS